MQYHFHPLSIYVVVMHCLSERQLFIQIIGDVHKSLTIIGHRGIFLSATVFDLLYETFESVDFLPLFIAEANLCKGKEILLCGKMQSGSYENKEGKKVYTLEHFVKEIEYCGKKEDSPLPYDGQGFMNIPDDLDEELPFR